MWKPQGIYANYVLHQPTVFFGKNAINGLISMPGAKISVIHGSSLHESDIDSLKRAFKKQAIYFNKRSWNGEPDLESLSQTIASLEMQQPDVIIAIGGGAVIDGAKICRLYYEYPSFEVGKTKINQLGFSTKFIAIPTTIGSGAEVSSAAVYINRQEHKKEMIVSHELQPEAIVLDAEYIRDSSYRLLVSSGIDAMAHILEGYVSNINNGICDIMAETGLRILVEEFSKNVPDYEKLQYAGYLGGVVQNHCIVGAAHGLAHQISHEGYSHGEAVALLLSAVIKVNAKCADVRERYLSIIKMSGMTDINSLILFIGELLEKSGIHSKRNQLIELLKKKIVDEQFVKNVADDQGAKGNPIEINKEYLENLLGEM